MLHGLVKCEGSVLEMTRIIFKQMQSFIKVKRGARKQLDLYVSSFEFLKPLLLSVKC